MIKETEPAAPCPHCHKVVYAPEAKHFNPESQRLQTILWLPPERQRIIQTANTSVRLISLEIIRKHIPKTETCSVIPSRRGSAFASPAAAGSTFYTDDRKVQGPFASQRSSAATSTGGGEEILPQRKFHIEVDEPDPDSLYSFPMRSAPLKPNLKRLKTEVF